MLQRFLTWLLPSTGVDLHETYFSWEELEEIGFERAYEIAQANAEMRQLLRSWLRAAELGAAVPPLRFEVSRKGSDSQGPPHRRVDGGRRTSG